MAQSQQIQVTGGTINATNAELQPGVEIPIIASSQGEIPLAQQPDSVKKYIKMAGGLEEKKSTRGTRTTKQVRDELKTLAGRVRKVFRMAAKVYGTGVKPSATVRGVAYTLGKKEINNLVSQITKIIRKDIFGWVKSSKRSQRQTLKDGGIYKPVLIDTLMRQFIAEDQFETLGSRGFGLDITDNSVNRRRVSQALPQAIQGLTTINTVSTLFYLYIYNNDLSVEVDPKNDLQSWGGTYYRTDRVLQEYFANDLNALTQDAVAKPTKYSKSYKNAAKVAVLKILKPSGIDGFRPKDISVIVNKHVIKETYYSGLTLTDLQAAANNQPSSPDRRASLDENQNDVLRMVAAGQLSQDQLGFLRIYLASPAQPVFPSVFYQQLATEYMVVKNNLAEIKRQRDSSVKSARSNRSA
ncbi:Hypothetical protein ORPV_1033 [Orpheovirus IHUMI-LCC2]|uniref:Uncharacterized protein n=1 Tax=Orpheovirus IHUMI-LCC2 TaxID=2023057 RepID=A0A2I2L5Y4_9VIRU|nr:Hypothetical protein ORPV_1033 [Orpheovirus IHUMI-LCC2]SNW62937.1 Hypothetical protein ORPV_1033 [Orpheovirus IHUMI-LCC2]